MDMETNIKEPAKQKPETPTPGANELHHFLADIEDLMREATSLTGDELNMVKANISARLASARASAEQLGSDIADQARKSATATNDYVHHQPWAAVGAGAAAGLLVGFLLSRRSN